MEIIVKVVWTLIATVLIFGVAKFTVGIWRSQVDWRQTAANIFALTQDDPTKLIATRASDAIYQYEKIVGRIEGEPTVTEGEVSFALLYDTANFVNTEPFEFRRMTLRMVQFGTITDKQKVDLPEGPLMRFAVIQRMKCEILTRK